MTQLFQNNAATTLASAITASATSCTVASGKGELFPSPDNSVGEYAVLTLTQAGSTETSWEEVYLTARSGDVLTIERAMEGSTALAWASGSKIEMRITAEALYFFQYTDYKLTILHAQFEDFHPDPSYIPAPYTLSNGESNNGVGGDRNKQLTMVAGWNRVVTIPAYATASFVAGDSLKIFNRSDADATIIEGDSAILLYRSGVFSSHGTRTLSGYTLATLTYVGTDSDGNRIWIADGNGVT